MCPDADLASGISMEMVMNIYDELGVKKLINCAGTYTIVGGSRMSQNSLKAICEAAGSHVLIKDMQKAVNAKIAELTGNEACCVTAGAMVGVYLSMAGCVSLKFGKAIRYISPEDLARTEILMFRAHRNPYDRGLSLLGVKLVEVGYANNIDMIDEYGFENAINENTAGVLYLPSTDGGWVPPGALSFEKTIEICARYNVPIVVDAAAQLPPKSNLWRFTQKGAAAVLFSGGKYLCGPQTAGLCLGKKYLLDWVDVNNFPNYGIGRIHKVGREELAGMYVAVKEYINRNESLELETAEHIVSRFTEAFSENDLFEFQRAFPNEAGQPMARAKLIIHDGRLSAEGIRDWLLAQDRAIFSMVENGYLYVNPMTLTEEEAEYILSRFIELNQEGGI